MTLSTPTEIDPNRIAAPIKKEGKENQIVQDTVSHGFPEGIRGNGDNPSHDGNLSGRSPLPRSGPGEATLSMKKSSRDFFIGFRERIVVP